MVKACSYMVDVSVDEHQELITQCECAAGMGPEAVCKHVQTTLLAICEFTSGKDVKFEHTCTGKLQTFHQPRKRNSVASPVKACNLKLGKRAAHESLSFDPRPVKYRKLKSYPDHVKNLTINFCANTLKQVPLLQTIGPANIRALELDHDYLKETLSDTLLRKENISHITPEIADQIEEQTEGQSDSKRWFTERKKRLASSKFGKIIKSKSDQAKKNIAMNIIESPKFTSRQTKHGLQNEPHAIKKYMTETGNEVNKCGLIVSIDKPHIASSPDGLVGDDIVLEVKCPHGARKEKITPKAVPYLKLKKGVWSLDKKHDYYAQVQGQMYCTERNECHFVVYTFKDVKVVNVPRDDLFIKNMVLKLDKFFCEVFKPVYLRYHLYKEL